jgi:hypothetical protein
MGRLAIVGTAMVQVAGDTDLEMSLYFRVLTGRGQLVVSALLVRAG